MASEVKDPNSLVNMATKVNLDNFLQLVEETTQLLARESGQVGDLRITGRLVNVAPKGEMTVIGDIHGDLESLLHVLKNSRFMEKACKDENTLIVFLGDYGDRGSYSPEVYYVVLKLKTMFPKNVVLMRGNHEGPRDLLAYPHDLPAHLHRKFGEAGANAYTKLCDLFNHLYNAVLIDERYVMLHGGVPSQASNVEDLAYAHEKHPRETHLEEILWSDPQDGIKGTYPSPRGAGMLFGEDITDRFLKMLSVKALIRGHEPSMEGFKTNHNEKILTIFSRRGPPYYNERGAYLQLNTSEILESAEQLKKYVRKF